MLRNLICVICGILMTALVTPARAGVMIDRVVAVVNDDIITMSDLQKEVASRAQETLSGLNGKEREAAEKRLNREVLNLLVERHLQLDLAKKRGVFAADDEVKATVEDIKKRNNFDDEALMKALEAKNMTIDDYRKALKDEIIVNKLVYREVKSRITVTDSEVAEYYKVNKTSFSSNPSATVKHVLVAFAPETPEETRSEARRIADEIAVKLRRGDDFPSVMGDYAKSQVPVSGTDLGTIKQGDLIPELDGPAFALKPGEVSDPFLLADGYHLIKVMERTDAQLKPLSEVKGEISKVLFNQKSEEQYYKWLKELRSNAFVEIKLGE